MLIHMMPGSITGFIKYCLDSLLDQIHPAVIHYMTYCMTQSHYSARCSDCCVHEDFDSNALYSLPFGRLAITSMTQVGYNVASWGFLGSSERNCNVTASSPIFHSVANTVKRLGGNNIGECDGLKSAIKYEGSEVIGPVSGFVIFSEIKLTCKSRLN